MCWLQHCHRFGPLPASSHSACNITVELDLWNSTARRCRLLANDRPWLWIVAATQSILFPHLLLLLLLLHLFLFVFGDFSYSSLQFEFISILLLLTTQRRPGRPSYFNMSLSFLQQWRSRGSQFSLAGCPYISSMIFHSPPPDPARSLLQNWKFPVSIGLIPSNLSPSLDSRVKRKNPSRRIPRSVLQSKYRPPVSGALQFIFDFEFLVSGTGPSAERDCESFSLQLLISDTGCLYRARESLRLRLALDYFWSLFDSLSLLL